MICILSLHVTSQDYVCNLMRFISKLAAAHFYLTLLPGDNNSSHILVHNICCAPHLIFLYGGEYYYTHFRDNESKKWMKLTS